MNERAARRWLLCLLVVMTTVALTGCAWFDERAVRSGLEQTFEGYVNPTVEEARSLAGHAGIDISTLDEVGIDVPGFMAHAFGQFSYQITEVSVDGGHATALVSVSNVDCAAVAAQLQSEFAARDDDAYAELLLTDDGEQAMTGAFFEELYERLDAAQPETRSMTLQLTKEEGAWHLDEASEADLALGLFGDAAD